MALRCYERRDGCRGGKRLTLPDDGPASRAARVRKCWMLQPGSRPSFAELHTQLDILQQARA